MPSTFEENTSRVLPISTEAAAWSTASQPASYFIPIYVTFPVNVGVIVNRRAIYLEEVDELRETALDYYVFQRNAFVQNRHRAVNDLKAPEEEAEEDLYYFDEDEEE